MPVGLVLIMFSLGLGLTPADFGRIVKRPKAFFVGALHQLIILPILAFNLILVFEIDGEIAVGIMILAACPGGAVSNIVSKFAGWDVALSITLTATLSLLSMITVPLVMGIAINQFMGSTAPEINIISTVITMFLFTVVPITIGLILRIYWPLKIELIEPVFSKVAVTFFVIIIVGAIATNWDLIVQNLVQVGLVLAVLIILITFIAIYIPKKFGCSGKEAKTISVETSVQNAPLGLVVASILVGGQEAMSLYAVPSAAYGVVWYLTMLPIALLMLIKRRNKKVNRSKS
ncbi:MAG: bile acid:sodium symporter family protein [Lentilitoribacter sp.]